MATPERAIAIATEAHAGQVDKAGEAYILHALRLVLAVETTEERMAAVLHDVVEDTDCSCGGETSRHGREVRGTSRLRGFPRPWGGVGFRDSGWGFLIMSRHG